MTDRKNVVRFVPPPFKPVVRRRESATVIILPIIRIEGYADETPRGRRKGRRFRSVEKP
jgi:hypothetical protein